MAYFQTLFLEQESDAIKYNGKTYYRFWRVEVKDSIKLRFRLIDSNSEFIQAILISFPYGFDGEVLVEKKKVPIKKIAFPSLNFWEDTAPKEFEVEISEFSGEIMVCNGSDPIGTKQFCKHLSEGCAMLVQELGVNKYRFYCHDHSFEGECDNLVFELEIEN